MIFIILLNFNGKPLFEFGKYQRKSDFLELLMREKISEKRLQQIVLGIYNYRNFKQGVLTCFFKYF